MARAAYSAVTDPRLTYDADQITAAALSMATSSQYLKIKVKPNAGVSALQSLEDGTWLAQLKSPPVDGKANAELIDLVAHQFGCARSAVVIRTGAGTRLKLVRISA